MKSERPRYLVVTMEHIVDEDHCGQDDGLPLAEKDVSDAIWMRIRELYGVVGASEIAMHLVELSEKQGFIILRTHLRGIARLRAALTPELRILPLSLKLRTLKTTGLLSRARAIVKGLG